MANNSIASGSVTLVANADNLVAGLKKSEADLQGWSKNVQKSVEKASSQPKSQPFLKGFFGGVGFHFAEKLQHGLQNIGQEAAKSALGLHDFERQMKDVDRQIRQSAELMERAHGARAKWLDVGDEFTVAENLRKEIGKLSAEFKQEEQALAGIDARLRELNDPMKDAKALIPKNRFDAVGMMADFAIGQKGFGDIANAIGAVGTTGLGAWKPMADMQQRVADAARDRMNATNAKVREAEEKLAMLLDPNKNPEKVKAADQMTRALENQAAAWNLTAREAAIFEMNTKGFSPKQVNAYMDAWDRLAASNKMADNRKMLDDFNASMERQFTLFGATAAQAELYDLKLKGLSEDQLAFAQSMLESRDALNKAVAPAEMAGAMLRGSTESYSLILKNQLRGLTPEKDGKKALDEAKKTAKATAETAKAAKAMKEVLEGLGVL